MRLLLTGIIFLLAIVTVQGEKLSKRGILLNKTNLDPRPLSKRGILLDKTEANTFFTREKRGERDLKKECCTNEKCSFHEREEAAEDHGWVWVHQQLCEFSIREGLSCKCQGVSKHIMPMECGADLKQCLNPCPDSKFHCGEELGNGRKCIEKSLRCDSKDDCGNWLDEDGCGVTRSLAPTANHLTIEEINTGTKLKGAASGSSFTGGASDKIRFPNPERGSNYVQGHVEIKHEGVWGTICDDSFDANNNGATVLCKMMGYSSGEYGTQYRIGETKATKIWLDDVRCNGAETDIANCQHAAWGTHNCQRNEDAAIKCTGSPPTGPTVRFPNPEKGSNYVQGHVEIKHEGVWGTICDDSFDANNNGATVLCKMMGYSSGEYGTQYRIGETKATKIWLDDVRCNGAETDIANCQHAAWGTHNCQRNEDVAIRCIGSPPTGGATTAQVNGGADEYQGNVYVNNLPVCDIGWSASDAEVACSVLGYSKATTKAIPWTGSKFGAVGTSFRMSNVQCTGSETSLASCSHVTSNKGNTCTASKGAGVTCIDSGTLRLVDGDAPTEGKVIVNGMPVCNDGWTENDSQVVCNQKFISKFEDRHPRNVPVKSTSSLPWTQPTSMRNVQCAGTETNLARCQLNAARDCPSQRQVVVQCARCTSEDLIGFLTSIRPGINIKETSKAVEAALARLKLECLDWDCSQAKQNKPYKEYCEVRAALEQTIQYLNQTDTQVITLQTVTDYGKELDAAMLKQNMAEVITQINNVGDRVDNFQTKLAEYFLTLADYDHRLAMTDLDGARGWYTSHERKISETTTKVNNGLRDIFAFAFAVTGAEIIENTADVALNVANAMNPVKGLVLGAEQVLDIKAAMTKLMNAGVEMAKLGRAMNNSFPRIEKMRKHMAEKKAAMMETTMAMEDILTRDGDLTEADVKAIIYGYGDFKESATPGEIAVLSEVLQLLASTACDAIDAADTLAGSTIALAAAATGKCPEIQPDIAMLISSYESSRDVQDDIQQALGRAAHAQLAKQKAESLAQTLGSSLNDKIKRQVAKLDSKFVMQVHKEHLIRDACNYLTYINRGYQNEECTKLLANPSLSTTKLQTMDFRKDMCDCPTCTTMDEIRPIPAKLNPSGAELSPGTIDLSRLYLTSESNGHTITKGSASFEIPNRQWLVDNGWISSHVDNGSPLFLKSLQLFVPPSANNRFSYEVQSSFQHHGSTLLKGKEYEFPDVKMKTIYRENEGSCGNRIESLYNLDGCRETYKQTCMTGTPGNAAPLYPTLIGSKWTLSLYSPSVLTKPYPEETFYLKVKASYCIDSKRGTTRRDAIAPKYKREPYISSTCCSTRKMAFDHLINLRHGGMDPCRACPAPSAPRMNGYYCESCPAGYQPSWGSFGCTPCGIAYFKATAGNVRCERCPEGQTTIAKGQTHCVSGEGLPAPPPITAQGPPPEEETTVEVSMSWLQTVRELANKILEKFPSLR